MSLSTLPARLAHHAAATPQAPWLFAREPHGDHGWRWWSWSQIADRVARATAKLAAEVDPVAGARIGFRDRLDPDAVAAQLAILAAGAVPDGGDSAALVAWLGPDPPLNARTVGELPVVPLPETRSRLDRYRPAELRVEASPKAAISSPWSAVLAGPERPASPKWHLWRFFTERFRGRHRPLVVASAGLHPTARRQLFTAVLETGAAWALEPDPEAFVPAVLWTRPTVVAGSGAELGLLALAFGRRSARRARRLTAVLVSDAAGPEIVEESTWQELGVRVLRLDAA